MMGEDAPLIWGHLQKKFGLLPVEFACVLNNDFLDKSFMAGFDSVFSTEKLKRDGYPSEKLIEYSNAAECMLTFFDRLVEEKVIPAPDNVISGLYSVDVKKRIETDLEPAIITKGRAAAASSIQETQNQILRAESVEKTVEMDIKGGNVLTMVSELAKLVEEDKKLDAKDAPLM